MVSVLSLALHAFQAGGSGRGKGQSRGGANSNLTTGEVASAPFSGGASCNYPSAVGYKGGCLATPVPIADRQLRIRL